MSTMTKILGAGAVAAAMAAAPAAAQYGYSYGAPYGNAYGYYNNNNVTADAAQRCSAAVQARLNNRGPNGLAGIIGSVLGARSAGGRVLQVTQVNPRRNMVRVRGLANSGANYGAYGYGAYGATGYGYQPDLSFSCDVDYRGYIRDIDINRRR